MPDPQLETARSDAGAGNPDPASRDARRAVHCDVSTTLALYGDRALRELVDGATPLGTGIGGKSALLDVGGTPVFVKQVALTDLEREAANYRSTANVFGLPPVYQYGVGGPSFGVWRELAAYTMTTNWVLGDGHEGFPLMYHWRVLPDLTLPLPAELTDVERIVAHGGGESAVRARVEALRQSSACVVLFLEYIPQNLHQWLGTRVGTGATAGGQHADRAIAMVERELAAGTSFMNARGLLHFDAHFENILTDGRRLYFTDFGLSLSSRFELSCAEADFFEEHQTYDRCYTISWLVNWLVTAVYGYGRQERGAFMHACAEGQSPPKTSPVSGDVPEAARAILTRHTPLAAVFSDFYGGILDKGRGIPYPLAEIRRIGRSYTPPIG
jgi:hypothetical protein